MATELTTEHAAELRTAIDTASARMGLDSAGAELIRYTVNAVYRLRAAPVIARIGIGGPGLFRAPRVVQMARWLAKHDAPTVGLIDGSQPVIIEDRYAVTFWHELSTEATWTAEDLATPLRELHQLEPDPTLPRWDPFGQARRRLDTADPLLPDDDLRWLRAEWADVEHQYRILDSPLHMGVIHGDPHTGNLLRDSSGRIVLCDLDGAGIGPLAWDLIPQAVGAQRFGREAFNNDFAAAYDADVTHEPYWPVLARIRELIMVTSVIQQLANRPEIAAQHAHRLHSLRASQSNTRWSLYE